MKKILEKIVSIALAFIALLFVILLMVVMFKPEYAETINNPFVHVLLIIFACIFAILTTINIVSAFSDAEKINSVLLFKGRTSATKATISVVNKTAKKATMMVEGAKLKRVVLYADENNDLKVRLDLKVKSIDVENTVNTVRANVMTTFSEVLGLDFANIDFRLISVKNEYKPDSNKVDAKIKEFQKEIEEEKARQKQIADDMKAKEEEKERELQAAKAEALTKEEVLATNANDAEILEDATLDTAAEEVVDESMKEV